MLVYKIRNKENNKVYVGGTTQRFSQRKSQHKWFLRNNKHSNKALQKDYDRYGEDAFEYKIILDGIADTKSLEYYERLFSMIYKMVNVSYNTDDFYNYKSSKGMPVINTKTNTKYRSLTQAAIATSSCKNRLGRCCRDKNNSVWQFV